MGKQIKRKIEREFRTQAKISIDVLKAKKISGKIDTDLVWIGFGYLLILLLLFCGVSLDLEKK